jgi:MFS family permease
VSASSPGHDPIARRRNLVAVIVAMTMGSMTYGMSVPLMSLALDAQGVPSWLIGLSATAQAVAVLPIAPVVSHTVRRWGPARFLLLILFTTAVLYILLAAFPNVWAWFPLRFLLGAAGSAFWIVGEAWVNQVAAERSRGRVLSVNSMAVASGFAAGPLVLAQLGSQGWAPFLFLSGATLATMLPVAMALRIAPSLKGKPTSGVFAFIIRAPVPVLISGLYSAIDGLLLSFLPIYAFHFGVPEAQSLLLITALGVGGIVGQIPFGWLIDAVDRYLLVTVSVVLMIVASALVPLIVNEPVWGFAHFLIFGALHGGVYTTGMAILGAQYQGPDLASGSGAFGVTWGAGNMVGPAVGGLAMRVIPEISIPVCLGLFLFAFLPLPVAAILRRRRP